MGISLQGYNNKSATFLTATSDLEVGEIVSMSSGFKVARSVSGDYVLGVCSNIDGDYAGVVTQGIIEVPYTGTAPSVGVNGLIAAGSGAVKVDLDSMLFYHVINIDTTNKILTILL